MTVHVLIPVFNRLPMTQAILTCLRAQRIDEPLSITVIDDGSTDGSGEFLYAQPDVYVSKGDGTLWWGGAIHLGMRYVLENAASTDWVVLVNNDTYLDPDFLQGLLKLARSQAPAAVGAAIRHPEPPHRLLSIGPRIDAWRLTVCDVLFDSGNNAQVISEVTPVDALSGRGVIYPVSALKAVHGLRPRWLPHYLADYELSMRVRKAGWQLLVSPTVSVQSDEDFGNLYRGLNWRDRFFSARSPFYLPAQICFWWAANSPLQRISLPLRLVLFALFPALRKRI